MSMTNATPSAPSTHGQRRLRDAVGGVSPLSLDDGAVSDVTPIQNASGVPSVMANRDP